MDPVVFRLDVDQLDGAAGTVMNPVVFRLDVDQLDGADAVFVHPEGAATFRLARSWWLDAGRPSRLHVGLTDDEQHALNWLR
jgi:hypothetical protein